MPEEQMGMGGRFVAAVRRFFNLPRNVVLLGWTSLLTDVGSEMILPILPLFLKGALGAPIAAIAFIEGVAEATANGFKLVSGGWADRTGQIKWNESYSAGRIRSVMAASTMVNFRSPPSLR